MRNLDFSFDTLLLLGAVWLIYSSSGMDDLPLLLALLYLLLF